MSAIAVVQAQEMAEEERWDTESYEPELRRLEKAIGGQTRLSSVATVVHPTEIPRIYTGDESGVPFVLAANIKPILPNFGSLQRIPETVAKGLPTNRLTQGDVMVTRTGANRGVACVYLEASGAFYASGEGLIVRPGPGMDGAYLGLYLGCHYGHRLCLKATYGSGQPHIAPPYLRKVPVLRIGEREKVVGDLVRDAWTNGRDALPLYAEAQNEMMNQLGWSRIIRPQTPLWHVEDFGAIATADRWDPEVFSPRTKSLTELLGRDKKKIGSVAKWTRRPFVPNSGQSFEYIEISDVDKIGRVGSSSVLGENAPDRAKWLVAAGDVLTSTVRPIRRLTGVVARAQDGFTCSNGFAVLCPFDVEPEVLLVYLRLPPVAELLDVYTTGSMYPAIAPDDILRIPFALPSKKGRERIVASVQAAWKAQARADATLKEARHTLEQEIQKRLK